MKVMRALTSWRGVLALVIALFHFHNYPLLAAFGDFRMSFFFMVSGFLLAQRYEFREVTRKNYLNFMGRRVLRIYPLHIVALALFGLGVLLFGGERNVMHEALTFLLDALLLQSWSPVRDIYMSHNSVTWFLSSIMFCYLCYPFAVRWLRARRLWTQVALLAACLAVVLAVAPMLEPGERQWWVFICPPVRMIDFTAGVVLFNISERVSRGWVRNVSVAGATLAEVLALGAIATVTVLQYFGYIDRFAGKPLKIVFTAMFILVLVLNNRNKGILSKALSWGPLYWLGQVSYEVYVMQLVVLNVVRRALATTGLDPDGAVVLVLYLVTLVAVAGVCNKWFGRLSQSLRSRYLDKP